MKTLAEALREKQALYYPDGLPEYKDFKVGDRVQVITPCQDHRFFFDQTGVVTKNSGKYLGISVSFDVPMEYEDGYILREYNFEPGDLVKLKKNPDAEAFLAQCLKENFNKES
jgi:ribosomal protein L21E